MFATDILKNEHKLVLAVLDGAEQEAKRIRNGEAVNYELIEQVVDFSRNFTDGCHHKKEEKILFPKMCEFGFSKDSGPIAVMLMEHVEGRRLVGLILSNLNSLKTREEKDQTKLANSIVDYVYLLRGHIEKENNILFSMAERILTDDVNKEVITAFDKVESEEVGEGVHEMYHKFAHQFEK